MPVRSCVAAKAGGARRDRTDDLLLAKQALSQLSYGPGSRVRLACQPKLADSAQASLFKLRRATFARYREHRLVGLGRLELPTSRLSSARSNQLSYTPAVLIGPSCQDRPLRRPLRSARQFAAGKTHATRHGAGLVHEERETKTAKSRQWSSTILKLLAPDVSKTIR